MLQAPFGALFFVEIFYCCKNKLGLSVGGEIYSDTFHQVKDIAPQVGAEYAFFRLTRLGYLKNHQMRKNHENKYQP